jgi:hypothetical protein
MIGAGLMTRFSVAPHAPHGSAYESLKPWRTSMTF